MDTKNITISLDNDSIKTFIKAIDFYKLASGFLNYGEDIENLQKIKWQVVNGYVPKKIHQEITLNLAPYDIAMLLSSVEFLNLVGAYLGSSINTSNCQIIRDEIMNSLI